MMKNSPIRPWSTDPDQDFFETVSEEEIIDLWRSLKGKGLSEEAFSKTKASFEIEH